LTQPQGGRSKTPEIQQPEQPNENLNKSNQSDRKGRSLEKKHVTFPAVLETVHEESDDLERDVVGDSLISFAIQNSVNHNKVSQSRADEIL